MSWFERDLTFGLVVITLTFNILSGPYVRNGEVYEVHFWMGH